MNWILLFASVGLTTLGVLIIALLVKFFTWLSSTYSTLYSDLVYLGFVGLVIFCGTTALVYTALEHHLGILNGSLN